MIKLLKGVWKALTSPGDGVKTFVDSGMDIVDKVFYTKEEKAENRQKVMDYYLEYQRITSPQNRARRVIAFTVTGLFVLLVLAGVIANGLGSGEFAKYIFETIDINIRKPFEYVVIFYFGVHLLRALKK